SDVVLTKDWKEHKPAEMINELSVHIYQLTLTNERNNVNISGTTNGKTFNSGLSEKNISKRDQEEIHISIFLVNI
ncbi:12210_t:CDS:1, partial [Funneliformis mosseae]